MVSVGRAPANRRFTITPTKPTAAQVSIKKQPEEELGFLTSQLSGVKISHSHCHRPLRLSAPFRPCLQPVARRVCPLLGKKANRANKVSHSNHKTKRLQFVNLQYKRIWWESGKRFVRLRLATKALKTREKNRPDVVANNVGIDLSKEQEWL